MESNEVEAITNPVLSAVEVNVLGTRNMVEAAVATGAERFLMISTDKAVNPTGPSTLLRTGSWARRNAWRRRS